MSAPRAQDASRAASEGAIRYTEFVRLIQFWLYEISRGDHKM